MSAHAPVYHPREPADFPLWKVLHNHDEAFKAGYDEDCEKQYGSVRERGPQQHSLSRAHRQLVLSIPIMLKAQGRTSDVLIEKLMVWHHSGFHVDITLTLIGAGHPAA